MRPSQPPSEFPLTSEIPPSGNPFGSEEDTKPLLSPESVPETVAEEPVWGEGELTPERQVKYKKMLREFNERLRLIAHTVSGDRRMVVEPGQPGAWHWNPKLNAVRWDPLEVLQKGEKGEDELKGKIAHEGGHRAVTRYFGFVPEEVMATVGMPSLLAAVEERPTDQVVRDRFSGAGQWVDAARQGSAREGREVLQQARESGQDMGYIPRFKQLCSLIVYHPQYESCPEGTDPEVFEFYDQARKVVEKIEHTLPPEGASEDEVMDYAIERYRLTYRELWPQVQEFAKKDLEDEQTRQTLMDELRDLLTGLKDPEDSDMTPEELVDLIKKILEAMSKPEPEKPEKGEAGEKGEGGESGEEGEAGEEGGEEGGDEGDKIVDGMGGKSGEKKEQKKDKAKPEKGEAGEKGEGGESGEEGEAGEEGGEEGGEPGQDKGTPGGKNGEQKGKPGGEAAPEGQGEKPTARHLLNKLKQKLESAKGKPVDPLTENIPVPMDKLSPELKEKARRMRDKLPERTKKAMEEKARKALEKSEDELTEQIGAKMVEGVETHEEQEERVEQEAKDAEEKAERERQEAVQRELDRMEMEVIQRRINESAGSMGAYERTYQQIHELDEELYRELQKIFKPNLKDKISLRATGSRLNLPAVFKWDASRKGGAKAVDLKIFETLARPETKDYAVTLLVDLSGSMGDKIEETFKAVVLLTEVLNRLGIKLEIIGFQDEIIPFLDFDKKINDSIRAQMGGMLREVSASNPGGHNNNNWNDDGPCLLEASARLAKQGAKEKFLIVLSDGQPAGKHSTYNDLHQAVKQILTTTDQRLIAIGLGPGTEHVGTYYPFSAPNIPVSRLAEKLAGLIRDVVIHPDAYAYHAEKKRADF